jgi:tRNA G18 (ribose-2'-O)-methylase SpoU
LSRRRSEARSIAAPSIVPISAPEDARIAVYRAVRERDLAGREGGFIAEGEVVLRVALSADARCRPSSLLVAENRLARLQPLIADLDPAIPVYAASPAVMDAIVGFPMHRGILAFGARPPDPGAAALLARAPARALVMVLIGIANHDNMGGLFRNAAAFGVHAVLFDHTCCDPLYRKAIRVSVGASLKVPFARLDEDEDVIDRLAAAGFTPLALSPAGAAPIAQLARPARAAILLGAEGPGLPEAILARCRTVAIPMAAGWDSLNVAAASAIILHALA